MKRDKPHPVGYLWPPLLMVLIPGVPLALAFGLFFALDALFGEDERVYAPTPTPVVRSLPPVDDDRDVDRDDRYDELDPYPDWPDEWEPGG